jgi:hypothetical protein
MRVADGDELKVNALPVLTARMSGAELADWFPFELHQLSHPQEVPEPSKAALIQLETGEYFVMFWGEISNQLTLRIPTTTDATAFLSAFFSEVPLPRGRILWRRSDARLPRHIAAKRVSLPRGAVRDTASSSRRRKN